jgi:hypothetical protein
MLYKFVREALTQRVLLESTSDPLGYLYDWQIRLYYKDGGLKKEWDIGQDQTSINKINFELNKHICGAGSINFAFLDFPIDVDDYIEFYYQGELKYRALVDVTPDVKGGDVKLIPYSTRLNELFDNSTFTSKTVSEIIQTVIENNEADTGIEWNSSYIDTGSSSTYSKDYSGYEIIKKIIDENIKSLDDREYGVNPNNIFTIYQPSTTVDKIIFYGDDPAYTEIEFKQDLRKIKATRYQVFKKVAASGETTRIGQVGYGGSYPTLSIENNVRKKIKKYTVSEKITDDSEALEIAYANLQANAISSEVIKVKELDISKYFPVIGERLTIQDSPEYINYTIIECDSLTDDDNSILGTGDWTGATLDTTDFTDGTGSVKFTSGTMDYTFDQAIRIFGDEKISWMMKGTVSGDYITLNIYSNTGLEKTQKINISTGQVWEYKQVDITGITDILKVEFTYNTVTTSTVNIDRIQLFGLYRFEYTANVVQASISITNQGTRCTLTLDDYDIFANDENFENERNIEKLEAISQDT